MGRFTDLMPGFGVALSIVMLSFLAAALHPGFDPLALTLILGMLASNILGDREPFVPGIDFLLRTVLPLGLAFYGFQLDVSALSVKSLAAGLGVAALMFFVTYFVGRGFGMRRANAVVTGIGLSSCGPAAIALLSPGYGADRDDSSISIISVLTVGLTGMLIFRFLPDLFGLENPLLSFLTGTSLPMLGMVQVTLSGHGGADVYMYLRMAVLAVFFAVALIPRSGGTGVKWKSLWFLGVFLVLAATASLTGLDGPLGTPMAIAGKVLLSIGLAAVGMTVEFDAITRRGSTTLLASFLSWSIVVLAIYLAASLMV